MLNRLHKLCAVLIFGALFGIADAAEPEKPPVLSKEQWKIADVSCPVGCSQDVKRFIKGYFGQTVIASPTQFSAPYLDQCSGNVQLVFKTVPTQTMLDGINKGISHHQRKMTAQHLKVRGNTVNSAIAYCQEGDDKSLMARILLVESNRILVLFEQQSIVELR